MSNANTREVILTGLRANSGLTIGNYFGAIVPMINMATRSSDQFQVNMFVPDLHSFTTPIDHDDLYEQVLHNARMFVAAGLPLDNPNIHLYRQSFISAHSELTWILDCFSGFGQMERMTQFKDKSAGQNEVSVGLFNYPVLMAADILLYGAKYIPVGDDQTQHIEFTRDIAERMNRRFGDLFIVPEPVAKQHEFFGRHDGLRIRDLISPDKKMSKSNSGKGSVFLSDTPTDVYDKIMGATTDSLACVAYNHEKQPGISNLIDILSLLRGVTPQDVNDQYHGMDRYGEFKKIVAEEAAAFITSFQKSLAGVNDQQLQQKLTMSEEVMRQQAGATLHRVQLAVGLRRES